MTDTDWLALADFLDAHANDMRAWTEDEPKFRATAEGLRQLAAITAAIGDRQRIADALTEVADYHVTECVDMHGDQGEDGPGDGCCFHARAAYRVGDAARLLRGAASLSPTPTPKFVCPVCGEWRDREGTCDACIPLVHDMLADAAPTPTPDHCPTCDSDDPRRRHAVESWISDSIRCDEPCVSPWHRYDSGQP